MSFTVRGTAVSEALNELRKIIGSTELVNIQYEGGKLTFSNLNHDIKASVTIACEGKGKVMKFGANTSVVSSLCGSRAEMTFERTTESSIEYKSVKGKYSGNFICVPFQVVNVVSKEIKGNVIKESLQNELAKWLPKMAITNYFTGESMVVLIRADKTGLKMATADSSHGVIYEGERDMGKLLVNIPISNIPLITSLLKDDKNGKPNIAATEANLVFWNDKYQVSLPLVSSTKNLDQIIDAAKSKTVYSKLDNDKLNVTLDNIIAFYEDRAQISVIGDGKKTLVFELKTGFGTGRDNVELDKEVPKLAFRIDPRILQDMVSRMSGSVSIGFCGETSKKGMEPVKIKLTNKSKNGKFTTFCVTMGS